MKFKVIVQSLSGNEVVECKDLKEALKLQEHFWKTNIGVIATGMKSITTDTSKLQNKVLEVEA